MDDERVLRLIRGEESEQVERKEQLKNKPKTLSIWYTFRGREFQETLNENDFLELPGPEAFRDERR